MDIKNHAKKVLAVIISVVLTISLLPVYSFADEETESKDLTNTKNTLSSNTEENNSEETNGEDDASDIEESAKATNLNSSSSNKTTENQSEENGAVSSLKDESNKKASEDDPENLISEYVEKNDLANSWRYTNGELTVTEVRPKTRAVSNAWEWTEDGYISSNGSVIEGAKYKGIDVSEHNGKIDWEAVKADGIDFAIIRCGYGMDEPGQDDDRWEYNVSECERLGIPYGVYLYSYADNTTRASKEADHTLRLLEGHNPQLPVYYDLEETSLESTSNRTLLANMAKTYCNKIENAGYEAGVYSNTNWWNNYLTSSVFDQWDRWVAQYNYECRYEGEYTLWQCTSTGKVDGVKGNVDINFMFNNKYMESLDDLAQEHKDAIKDGIYTVHSALDSSKVLDVASASISNSGNVQIYEENGTNAQQWKVSHDSKGYVTFTNINSGKVLDVKSGNAANGTNVQQYSSNNSDAQKWIVIKKNDGEYEIFSAVKRSILLDVKSGKAKNGTNVQIYASNNSDAQRWTFKQVDDPIPSLDKIAKENEDLIVDGEYYIASSLTEVNPINAAAVLDVKSANKDNLANVQLYAANASKAQQWKVTHDDKGYIIFTNVNSGKVLDVKSAHYTSGTNVQQYESNDSRAQKWYVTKEKEGYVIHSALWSNMVLDIATSNASNGSNIQIKALGDSGSTSDQQWDFINLEEIRSNLDNLALENKDIISDGVYVIKSKIADTKVLDVKSGSKANSANVQSYESNMTGAQQWKVTHDKKGYVTFTNIQSGKVLDIKSAKFSNGTNVQQYSNNDSYAQKWIVTKADDGSYVVESALGEGICLDIKSASASNGANVQIYASNETKAQKWEFLEVNPNVEPCKDLKLTGTYTIASAIDSNYVLDVASASKDNGANVQIYEKNGTNAQKFTFKYIDGYYQIINMASGKALDVEDGNLVPTTNIQQWSASATNENQLFSIRVNSDGTYSFINKATNLVLDVQSGKVKNKANLQGYTSNETKAQTFVVQHVK